MFSICFAVLFVLAHFPLILAYIQFQAHVKSSNQGLAGARCPSSPLPFRSDFLSQLPLNSLSVPMFLMGSIHQNVLTFPRSVYLIKLINSQGSRCQPFQTAVFKHLSKNGLTFPGTQYLLLPLTLGTVWVLRGHSNENVLIRCPPSLWKCQAPFPVSFLNMFS